MNSAFAVDYNYADVSAAINTLYGNKTDKIAEVNQYLKGFQRSAAAWVICVELLRDSKLEQSVFWGLSR